jgi:hypothetical protein
VHIPIESDALVTFTSNGRTIHMEPGYAYLFDNAQVHTAANPSAKPRVHLTFDTIGSARMFDLMANADALSPSVPQVNVNRGQDALVSRFEVVGSHDPEVVSVSHGHDVEVLSEQWSDAGVFTPLLPSQVNRFLVEYLMPMIHGESGGAIAARALILDFGRRWGQLVSQTPDGQDTSNVLKVAAQQFTLDVIQLECDRGRVALLPTRRPRSTSMTLSDAVESFARMLWYECLGWEQHPMASGGPPCFAPGVKRGPF